MERTVLIAPRPWLRALVAGVVGVAVALLAHTSVDGDLPSVTTLAVSVVVLTVLARGATAVEVRLPVLLAGLIAVQLGLHAVFLYLATGRGAHTGTAGWLCCGDATPIRAGSEAGLSRSALVLLAGHLLAVVVTALWLRHLEVRVWRAARSAATAVIAAIAMLLGALVAFVRSLVPAPRPQVGAPTAIVLPLPASLLLTRAVSRRGPPVLVGC